MGFFEAKVKEIIQETSDSYSYCMEIPDGLTWKAGQHAMFRFRDYQVAADDKEGRVFTIASAPEDGYLMFTTRIGELHTSYKEILLKELKAGDVILVARPMGSFDFRQEADRTLVVAGGIGITPIRSLLAHYEGGGMTEQKITLLYSDDRGEFCYRDFWKRVTEKMPNLELHLISDRDEFTSGVSDYARDHGNAADYMIAGSPGMNKAFSESLQEQGIEKDRIRTDNFMGY